MALTRTSINTYLPDAVGALIPYYETGYTSAPSASVQVFEDTTGALLGSGVSGSTPDASGPHAGRYPFAVLIPTWEPAASVIVAAGAAVVSTAGAAQLRGTVQALGASAALSPGAASFSSSAGIAAAGAAMSASAGSAALKGTTTAAGASLAATAGAATITFQASGTLTAAGAALTASAVAAVLRGLRTGVGASVSAAAGAAELRGVRSALGASVTASAGAATLTAASDTTAPSVGTLSVPSGTAGTAMTTINPGTSTDAVGIVGWMIKDAATTDSFTAPVAGDAGWTTISSTTSWAPGAALSYTPATAGSPRYFRLYLKDAAGNVGASATASATVSAAASGPIVLHNPGFELPIGSTGSADWWADTTPPPLYGLAQVGRLASTELAGAYVAVFHMYDGDDGYDQGTPAGAFGALSVRITRATIDASSGVLGPYSMKFMYAPSDSRMLVELKAYNSGGTVLKDIQINIFGSGGAIADADTAIDNPYNTTYQRKVNVKAQLVAAGTTWANVDHVDVIFTGVTNGTGNGQLYVYLDSFATS